MRHPFSGLRTKRLLAISMISTVLAVISANATVIVDVNDVGGNVVVSGGGSLDLTGAAWSSYIDMGPAITSGGSNWQIASFQPSLYSGYTLTSADGAFGTNSSPVAPTSIAPLTTPSSNFGLWADPQYGPVVAVAPDYVSGAALNMGMTFANTTIADMGMIEGTYNYTIPNDSIILNIGPQSAKPSFGDYVRNIIQPAIHWTPLDIQMAANFSPVGMTLTDAAKLGGYDHFNWYQIALAYPGSSLAGHPAPFVDPPTDLFGAPIGGLGTQRADSLPFYWDETDCSGCDPRYNLHDPSNTSADDSTLYFDDLPADIYIPALGDTMSFVTQLAGVRSDGTWDALSTFYWSSDYHCILSDCSGGLAVSRNLDPFPVGGAGGILDAHEITDLTTLPLNVRDLMAADGATNVPVSSVPEPSTIILLATGLLFLLLRKCVDASSRLRPAANPQHLMVGPSYT